MQGIPFATLLDVDKYAIPRTIKEAMARVPTRTFWQDAVNEEMASLQKNGTWDLVQQTPGMKVLPCKWVFDIKCDAQGRPVRFKARLVAGGHRQIDGVDVDETYAPVSKHSTLRTFLAVAAYRGWKVHQMDIKTAFLHGTVEEDVHMRQPPGFVDGTNLVCKLLAQVPDSVLWLLQDDQARGNLRREALAHGVDPHRLVFAAPLPQAAHLARLPLADLVLDTAPYNAHTTASDALWAGVPVVTWAGDTFAGRVAGSLLHAVGLPELVTEGPTAYAELALALATDATRRQALRHRLWQRRGTAPLFDVLGYTAALEGLFLQMWQRHADGLAPAHLGVASPPDTNQPAAYGDVPSTSLNTLTACTRALA